jgi:outer membrane protein assembly factor BamB
MTTNRTARPYGTQQSGPAPTKLRGQRLQSPAGRLGVRLAAGCLLAASLAQATDWPGWRGPARDGHAPAGTSPLESLPNEPKVVWRLKVGDGLAAPIVAGDRVYHLDAVAGREVVHAVRRDTGEVVWTTPLDDGFRNGQTAPGPRCTPLLDGDRLYAQSCKGELQCLSAADGTVRWRVGFTKEFHAVAPAESGVRKGAQRHGFTASPWIDGDRLIVLVGDPEGAGVVCFDKRTGAVLWRSTNDHAANAAPITAAIPGSPRRQVLAFTVEGFIGLDLEDGHLLWRIPVTTTYGRHVTTPIVVGNVAMVASKEEPLMGVALKPSADGRECAAEVKWVGRDLQVNFSSPVAVGGHVYGLGPGQNLFCVDARTGETRWSKAGFTDKPAEKAHLAIVAVGDRLLLLTETGELVLVPADPSGYRELGRVQVCGANWCNPAYADGRVYLRDSRELLCLQLK